MRKKLHHLIYSLVVYYKNDQRKSTFKFKKERLVMKKFKDEFGLDEMSITERMFRLDVPDLCESMLNLKDKDLLVSVPINIGSDQYFFIIEKYKDCSYSVKLCKGTSLKVIKEIKEYLKAYHVGGIDTAIDGTVSLNKFLTKCLLYMYPEYKEFKDFIKKDFLVSIVQDYALEDHETGKTLKEYIKIRINRKMNSI